MNNNPLQNQNMLSASSLQNALAMGTQEEKQAALTILGQHNFLQQSQQNQQPQHTPPTHGVQFHEQFQQHQDASNLSFMTSQSNIDQGFQGTDAMQQMQQLFASQQQKLDMGDATAAMTGGQAQMDPNFQKNLNAANFNNFIQMSQQQDAGSANSMNGLVLPPNGAADNNMFFNPYVAAMFNPGAQQQLLFTNPMSQGINMMGNGASMGMGMGMNNTFLSSAGGVGALPTNDNGNLMSQILDMTSNSAATNSAPSTNGFGVTNSILSLGSTNQKKSRKKDKDKPKRPLSAYNWFFKYERSRILENLEKDNQETSTSEATDKEEGQDKKTKDHKASSLSNEKKDDDSESESKPKSEELTEDSEKNTKQDSASSASKKKKKPHGKISFESLAKTIGERWAKLDNDSMAKYKKLADEDTKRYKKEMDEYMIKNKKETLIRNQQIQENETQADSFSQPLLDTNTQLAMLNNDQLQLYQQQLLQLQNLQRAQMQHQFHNLDQYQLMQQNRAQAHLAGMQVENIHIPKRQKVEDNGFIGANDSA